MIPGLSETKFRHLLREHLTPATAVSTPEHLHGRQQKLRQIDRAFNSPGRHAFIFGDRGVGKTSLALTAAVLHQSSDNSPIRIACDQQAGFFDLVKNMAQSCLPARYLLEKRTTQERLSLGLSALSYAAQESIQKGDIPSFGTINEAVAVLRAVCQLHSREPVVIIDEFDQLPSDMDRKYFADLIKQTSDQDVGVRFVFCGIGTSLEDLIGAHMSTGRYLAPVPLEPLTHDARWLIIEAAANALGVVVNQETRIRIGHISDGFPYYVHLIGEALFWAMFDDPEEVAVCQLQHFDQGVKDALRDAETALKLVYDRATQKYSDDYQEVLWAVADGKVFRRQIREIFESYCSIMEMRPQRKELTKDQFNNRLWNLAHERHGHILKSMGAGWYQFAENVVRGYVRLKAEEQGIRLGIDHHYA